MNILKESLFSSSSKSNSSSKKKKTRQNYSANTNILKENNALSEPLLSPLENDNNSTELGMIDSDDNDDETTLNIQHSARSRHVKPQSTLPAHGGGSIVIVEKPIRPQETIQAFAIRYRVPVSQLKRINNLQNDQDFYALKHCRVPVRRFGLLHESSSSPIIVNLNDQLAVNSSLPTTHLSQQNHHAFLNAMDHDLASMRAKVEQLIETPATTLIPDQPTRKMMIRSTIKPTSELSCDGADCGCKFWHIILAIILIALLIPLIYIYILLKSPPKIT
jgi:LysM repeat protein